MEIPSGRRHDSLNRVRKLAVLCIYRIRSENLDDVMATVSPEIVAAVPFSHGGLPDYSWQSIMLSSLVAFLSLLYSLRVTL